MNWAISARHCVMSILLGFTAIGMGMTLKLHSLACGSQATQFWYKLGPCYKFPFP